MPLLLNTCPHPLRLIGATGEILYEAPPFVCLRLTGQPVVLGEAYGVEVLGPVTWDGLTGWTQLVEQLPDADEIDLFVSMEVGRYLAFSGLVARTRIRHVYGASTDPKDIVRDDAGGVQGTKRLVRYV